MSTLLAPIVLYVTNIADKTTTFPKYRPAVFIYNVAASEYIWADFENKENIWHQSSPLHI